LLFVPFYAALLVRGIIPWHYAVVPPLVWVALCLPAALAGRPLLEPLTTYWTQAVFTNNIAVAAPNLYMLCMLRAGLCTSPGLTLAAIGLAALGALALVGLLARQRGPLDGERLLAAAVLSMTLMAFLLPRMHERHFYAAEVLSIALALYQPRLWWLPIGLQLAALPGYAHYLLATPRALVLLGSVLNLASLLWLSFYARRLMVPGERNGLEKPVCTLAPNTSAATFGRSIAPWRS
jgi:hypothetical protein